MRALLSDSSQILQIRAQTGDRQEKIRELSASIHITFGVLGVFRGSDLPPESRRIVTIFVAEMIWAILILPESGAPSPKTDSRFSEYRHSSPECLATSANGTECHATALSPRLTPGSGLLIISTSVRARRRDVIGVRAAGVR